MEQRRVQGAHSFVPEGFLYLLGASPNLGSHLTHSDQ
jgi:hypothetical protein